MNLDPGILILTCLRDQRLLQLVRKINSMVTNRSLPIYVFVDKITHGTTEYRERNQAVIELCRLLVDSGEIATFRVAKSNLQTKRAWHEALNFFYEYKDYCIYIEDDLKPVRNPLDFLKFADEAYLENSILTFFPPRNHHDESLLLTDWPSLWGVGLSRNLYVRTFDNPIKQSIEEIEQVVKEKFSNLSYRRKIDGRLFSRIWSGKFTRALESATAWDTELHYLAWRNRIITIQSAQKAVIDGGLDETSISKSRNPETSLDKFHPRTPKYIKEPSQVFPYCVECESVRYFSNGLKSDFFHSVKNLANWFHYSEHRP